MRQSSFRAFFVVAVLCATVAVVGGQAAPAHAAGVVGTGTPASCTDAALSAALVGGGAVTFNCGPNPHTITLNAQKTIASQHRDRRRQQGGVGRARLAPLRGERRGDARPDEHDAARRLRGRGRRLDLQQRHGRHQQHADDQQPDRRRAQRRGDRELRLADDPAEHLRGQRGRQRRRGLPALERLAHRGGSQHLPSQPDHQHDGRLGRRIPAVGRRTARDPGQPDRGEQRALRRRHLQLPRQQRRHDAHGGARQHRAIRRSHLQRARRAGHERQHAARQHRRALRRRHRQPRRRGDHQQGRAEQQQRDLRRGHGRRRKQLVCVQRGHRAATPGHVGDDGYDRLDQRGRAAGRGHLQHRHRAAHARHARSQHVRRAAPQSSTKAGSSWRRAR